MSALNAPSIGTGGSRPEARRRCCAWAVGLTILEVANASYLAAFDAATIFYHAQVVLHVAAGIALAAMLLCCAPGVIRGFPAMPIGRARNWTFMAVVSWLVTVGTALVLTITGTATPYRRVLDLHIIASVLALAASIGAFAARGHRRRVGIAVILLAAAIAFPLLVRGSRLVDPPRIARIENPARPPLTPYEEGGGAANPFFPSSVRTVGDRLIPADFFLESKACGNKGCHPDITAQWDASMHHFSSFNNQWYRKSIEYMQEVVGTKPSKWCGGCHDQAVLLTGRMDRPIVEQIDTPQAQAGIGCLVCHSIVHVPDTMGQGGYVLEYPEMHRLVASRNRALQTLHDVMVRLDPGPHRATMLKPFHRDSRAEFCSACHKVHLDEPVNHYRWFRGFNEYDAWQGSAASGQGARSFYYPKQIRDCGHCHMPLVRSSDQGNVGGFVHSHRFPAANTAVPFVNADEEQLRATQEFLRAGILSVDIFAATGVADGAGDGPTGAGPAAAAGARPEPAEPQAAGLFPDLPEVVPGAGRAASAAGPRAAAAPVIAPLDRAAPFLRPGGSYRIDVVARTRGIGHFFPGGTVDAFDVWLELKVEDAAGRVIYWSGFVEQDGRGPVEAGAHRYRSLMVDAHGNEINKRNAWAARALVYARLIPPNAADIGRFRLTVPRDAQGPITFSARMNHRKFSWWNTQFSYAGVRDPGVRGFGLAPGFDDGPFVFTGDTANVSGRIKAIPNLPITVIAEDRVTLPLAGDRRGAAKGPDSAESRPAAPKPESFDRERFNDYGIGMLLQGDLVAATRAFETVTALDPQYADGFVNVARVLVQEGDHEAAIPALERALSIDAGKAGAHYFMALALKSRGRYEEALSHLRAASDAFPRDRVVRNQIGRILFLQRKFPEAIAEFERTLSVDPEDLTAHYNLMLCHRALGDAAAERREETLYARFKADESAQALTGDFRRLNPEANLERQPIHEHPNRWRPGGASRGIGR